MTRSSDRLPPLDWLRVFEAAGRLGGFSAAAREFGLTQAAVSQRIGNLEAWLGRALFVRGPRGVTLTVEGESYLPLV
ncbi:MAG TPA: LysR family transcriptional regulator, partial [Ruegeria sp.]|nr:LysR family transcriptional regulator [Ruegeria sp.]